ncbi:unnamed protein product [Mytilus edulis]|uniref:LRAT domain-containing protein n=1 Tax=Mytilus edulis TaxID=6550 RepID=A0A8S3QLE9_MYTED|nr:unnamed protein product [Mytilus edulis]
MTHFRVNRKKYYHHFILLGLQHIDSLNKLVTVAHYTTSYPIIRNNDNAGGKFIRETVRIKKDEPNRLLDFDTGVFIVKHENDLQTPKQVQEAYSRLLRRIDEEAYHVSWNNCEHIVNYIITGNDYSVQVQENRCCAHLCSVVTAELKDIGALNIILLSLLISIVGTFIRHAYVRVIVSTFISLIAKNVTAHCSFNPMEYTILQNALLRLSEADTLPYIEDLANVSLILRNIQDEANNPVVCEIAKKQVHNLWCYQLLIILGSGFVIETLFIGLYYCCTMLPVTSLHTLKSAKGALIVRFCSGYLSLIISIPSGLFVELNLFVEKCNSTVWFFIITFGISVIVRLLTAAMVGCCVHGQANKQTSNTMDINKFDESTNEFITSELFQAKEKHVRCVLICKSKKGWRHVYQFIVFITSELFQTKEKRVRGVLICKSKNGWCHVCQFIVFLCMLFCLLVGIFYAELEIK